MFGGTRPLGNHDVERRVGDVRRCVLVIDRPLVIAGGIEDADVVSVVDATAPAGVPVRRGEDDSARLPVRRRTVDGDVITRTRRRAGVLHKLRRAVGGRRIDVVTGVERIARHILVIDRPLVGRRPDVEDPQRVVVIGVADPARIPVVRHQNNGVWVPVRGRVVDDRVVPRAVRRVGAPDERARLRRLAHPDIVAGVESVGRLVIVIDGPLVSGDPRCRRPLARGCHRRRRCHLDSSSP